jgi:hypothetical protein
VVNQTPPPGGGGVEMGDIMACMDGLQSTMASLASRVIIAEVAAHSHTDMASAIYGPFDQLFGLMQGLHADRSMVFGLPPVGPMVVSHLGPNIANPQQGPVFPYPYDWHPGTGMAQCTQVSPGGHLKGHVG